jgi:formylmethanofuran dehydrogenase subunit E
MTEFMLLRKVNITRAKMRLNVDALVCHKCGEQLKEGDPAHKQRKNLYCQACWQKAFLDVED